MPREKVGSIPEFDTEGDSGQTQKEVKQDPEESKENDSEETQDKEKETPSDTSTDEETITEEDNVESSERSKDTSPDEDLSQLTKQREELLNQVTGLSREKENLLRDVTDIRGKRRHLRQSKTEEATKEASDELKNIHPDDLKVFQNLARKQGLATTEEVKNLFYQEMKQRELDHFIDDHPEFSIESDPTNRNWNMLKSQINSFYKIGNDPTQIRKVLNKARDDISSQLPGSDRKSTKATERKLKTASKGGGGSQRSSSSGGGTLTEEDKHAYRKGGFTEEEIKELDQG